MKKAKIYFSISCWVILILFLPLVSVAGGGAPANNNCGGAISLTPGNSCTFTNATVAGATQSQAGCTGTANEDVWFSFVAAASTQYITVNPAGNFDGVVQVYSGACGSLSSLSCDDGSYPFGSSGTGQVSGLTPGNTYFLRVYDWYSTTLSNANSPFGICITNPPTCPASLGGVNSITLPFSSATETTCGEQDNLTGSNTITCGSTWYFSAEDAIYTFTPTASGTITIDLTTLGNTGMGIHLYDGCPFAGSGGTCVGNSQSWSGPWSLCVNVFSGNTYYLVIDQDNAGGCTSGGNFSLDITAPGGASSGIDCSNPVNIASLPYSMLGESTACFGDDYNNSSAASCFSLYESGEDKVYEYTSLGGECIGITLDNVSTFSAGFQVYEGCPDNPASTCVASAGGGWPNTSASVVLSNPGTYYIVVDTWAWPMNFSYDISIFSYGSGPSNDLPCNADPLTLGVNTAGDNTCSGGAGEPGIPLCWWASTVNTVWYRFVCPPSGIARITTTLGTLTDTQIQVYSGLCNSLSEIALGCNDNQTACGGSNSNSEVLLNLTAGNTYHIAVDGVGDLTGSFSILVTDGSVTPPPTVQDCAGAIPVCGTSNITQAASYFGCGNIQEIPASGTLPANPSTNVNGTNSGCLLTGEQNIVFYEINITSNGSLRWTCMPAVTGFYDWILYELTGFSCSDVVANSLSPVRCNWNGTSTGGTGMQSTIPAGGSATNYETPLAVTVGDKFLLGLSNFSFTTGGLDLDFSSSTCAIGCVILEKKHEDFTAASNGLHNKISWSHPNAVLTQSFSLEKSKDASTFIPVYKCNSTTRNNSKEYFEVIDKTPFQHITYYRLAETGSNGKVFYSEVKSVKTTNTSAILSISPNPVNESLLINIQAFENFDVEWNIKDVLGKDVLSGKLLTSAGNNTIQIDNIECESGVYFVEARSRNGEFVLHERFVKN